MKGLNIKNKVLVYIVVYFYYGLQGTATAIFKYSDLGLHFEVGGVDFPHKLLCMPTLGGRGSGFAFFWFRCRRLWSLTGASTSLPGFAIGISSACTDAALCTDPEIVIT